MDTRLLLKELRQRLIQEHGFTRATLCGEKKLDRTTSPIEEFLIWLECTPEAVRTLEKILNSQSFTRSA